MKAITTLGNGSTELTEVPTPQPGTDQVLVRVHAATVNPIDVVLTAGVFHQIGVITHDRPIGLGWDLAGTVEAVGSGVTAFAVGDRVSGLFPAINVPLGGLADHALVPADDLALVPSGLSDVDAASVGLNALTAQQAIRLLGPAEGRSLLVTGAAGAVGGFALELLAGAGWELSGLARDADAEFVTARGAKLVTDLDATYDVVFDAAALQEPALTAVRPGGLFVGVQPSLPLEATEGRTVTAVGVVPDGAALAGLLEQAATGELTVRVAGSVPIEDHATAFAYVAAGGNRGRWVVTA
ncbi:NADP-dependent oxidoreductase [Nocardioides marmorisolisilvae]|nr:NADP-dependent oxidoreductase [Nocardioides marmorisolisilvae]